MPDNFINHKTFDQLDKSVPNNPAKAERTKIATILIAKNLEMLFILSSSQLNRRYPSKMTQIDENHPRANWVF